MGWDLAARDDSRVTHLSNLAFARASLPFGAPLVTVSRHPIGIPLAFATIVGTFLAILGIMMAVGHLRDRRSRR